MDPTKALEEALYSMFRDARVDALDRLNELAAWLGKGGFSPNVRQAYNEAFGRWQDLVMEEEAREDRLKKARRKAHGCDDPELDHLDKGWTPPLSTVGGESAHETLARRVRALEERPWYDLEGMRLAIRALEDNHRADRGRVSALERMPQADTTDVLTRLAALEAAVKQLRYTSQASGENHVVLKEEVAKLDRLLETHHRDIVLLDTRTTELVNVSVDSLARKKAVLDSERNVLERLEKLEDQLEDLEQRR